ncbi:SH3 domain-containing protein [Sphingomonas sp. GC_Shp_1]|uniref:SH3 domain-containing protein n=1 Tax=unclassified Sphingomonas TaxID=196159 RepID=UPI002269BF62
MNHKPLLRFAPFRPLVIAAAAVATLATAGSALAADAKKQPPYFASITAGQARMRTGPAKNYPASWLYRRADLPVRVLAVFKEWRKVEDPGGTQGWMLAGLLSERRTAIVRGAVPLEMRDRPSVGARLLWRAAPGVVGRLSACADGWCRLDVKGQAGFVEVGGLWGVDAGERLP